MALLFLPGAIVALATFPLLFISPHMIGVYLFIGAPVLFFVVGYLVGRKDETDKNGDHEKSTKGP